MLSIEDCTGGERRLTQMDSLYLVPPTSMLLTLLEERKRKRRGMGFRNDVLGSSSSTSSSFLPSIRGFELVEHGKELMDPMEVVPTC